MREEKKIHPVDKHVGEKLRNKRLEAGLSQEELGKAVGLTFQQIQKYERAYNRISASKLFDFANYLGVGISYFFVGLEEENCSLHDNEGYTFAEDNNGRGLVPIYELDQLTSLYASITNSESRTSILDIVQSYANDGGLTDNDNKKNKDS